METGRDTHVTDNVPTEPPPAYAGYDVYTPVSSQSAVVNTDMTKATSATGDERPYAPSSSMTFAITIGENGTEDTDNTGSRAEDLVYLRGGGAGSCCADCCAGCLACGTSPLVRLALALGGLGAAGYALSLTGKALRDSSKHDVSQTSNDNFSSSRANMTYAYVPDANATYLNTSQVDPSYHRSSAIDTNVATVTARRRRVG